MKTIRIPKYILMYGLVLSFLGMITSSFTPGGCSRPPGGGKELGPDAPIRFDGFYYKRGIMRPDQQQGNGYTYLRFYPDRTVLITTSASEPEKIARRFGRTHNQGDARFKLHEDDGSPAIHFSIKHFGTIQNYEGKAGRDSLQLRLYAGSSEFEYHDIYLFYEVEDIKD